MSLIESNLSLFEFILSLKRVCIVFWTTLGGLSIVTISIVANLYHQFFSRPRQTFYMIVQSTL